MPIVSLRDLYVAELRDLYDAEQQILEELPAMAAKATATDLRRMLDDHCQQTQIHIERLELLFRQAGEKFTGVPCEGIRGLVQEARRRMMETEKGAVLDAALIGAAQRIEHYEISAYGCARTYAESLGDHSAAHVLQQTLDEEGAADQRLTKLAEHGINEAAGEDLPEGGTRYRSHLRYMPSSDLPHFHYSRYPVVNRDKEHLGTLDGFIIESPSGRPLYFVVDSGGWFMGRRYVLPIRQLEADEGARVLWTDLDRDTISRYPAFDRAAFLGMDEEETARYERTLLNFTAPAHARGPGPRRYEELPEYKAPTWLMTGVWMTETSGFACVPPRAQSDVQRAVDGRQASTAERNPTSPAIDIHPTVGSPESELMMARGDREDVPSERQHLASDAEDIQTAPTEAKEPRIERYRER